MTDITSFKLLKNMPEFAIGKKWLAYSALCTSKQRRKIPSFNMLCVKDQNIIRYKCMALNRAIHNENWRDFDMIEISDAHKAVLVDMAKSFIELVSGSPDACDSIHEDGGVSENESDASDVYEPVWVARKWSRVCRCFQIGGKCPHEGKTCSFAHSVEQLTAGIKHCVNGDRCYHWCNKHECRSGAMPCECLHPGEDVNDVIARLELVQELPAVCEPVAREPVAREPVAREPVAREFVMDEQCKKTKTVYATEAEQLKNMLFETHMLLFEKDQELAEKTREIEQLRKEMDALMTNSAVRKAVSKKLTIDVAIAEASAPVEYTFSC